MSGLTKSLEELRRESRNKYDQERLEVGRVKLLMEDEGISFLEACAIIQIVETTRVAPEVVDPLLDAMGIMYDRVHDWHPRLPKKPVHG